MNARRPTATSYLLVGLFLLGAAACGHSASDACGQPEYGGKASDEAWLSMVDGEARTVADDAKAAAFTTPAEGAAVPSATPAAFNWTGGAVASSNKPHLPPVTGAIYYIKVTIPGRVCPLRALTTTTTWTPSAASWAIIAAATGTVSASIQSAYLRENRITEGPYRPTADRTFTLTR